MNSGIRLPLVLLAACVLASAAASTAGGRQAGQRGAGNSAEIEHRERERREREMNNRELSERQFMLRNMRVDGGKAPPAPRLAVAQIREDFSRLQVVNNDLARAVAGGGALDLKFVSKSAAEIRKLAGRLKENMALPEPADAEEGREAKAAPSQLGPALSALDRMILAFADGIAAKGVYQVDARSSAKARRELEDIIALSEWVKKTSEKSKKAPGLSQ